MIVDVERRGMPSQLFGAMDYVAVLVQGEANDLACYIDQGEIDWVAMYGDKVTLAEACVYFPPLIFEMQHRGLTYRGPAGG